MGKSIIDYVKGVSSSDLLGENSYFRGIVTNIVEAVVSKGNWFGFCTRVDNSQVDIFSMENKDGIKLGSLIVDEIGQEDGYRTSLYRYLLHEYLCYCESPTVVKRKDYSGYKDSYNKSLVTSNISVIAEWLGIPYDEAKLKYGSRFDYNMYDRGDTCYSYVKLTVAKDGTKKVSKPRKDLDLATKGMRIVPLFAIKKGIDVLYDMCLKDFYNVTFVKDSGQKRSINVCFDYDKLCEVYNDKGLLSDAYQEQFKGDFLNVRTLERGYIKVIEVGTNLRNYALRSINLARILKIEKADPDLTFVNVDLDTVKSTFLSCLYNKNINYKEFVDMLDIFKVGTTRNYNGKVISSYSELESWTESQEMLLSTPFLKQLALFMMGNPQWFDNYTGERKEIVSEDINDTSESDDLDLDFDFL